jgi:DNA (cytosine-5)-methyltransferase 1
MSEKPRYCVPSMAEIVALPWNGFTVASTFSGCGGSSLGYRMAGFRVLWASEFIPAARESYRVNAAEYTVLDGRDIRQIKANEVLSAIELGVGDLDLLDGSPPCAAFSEAGPREKSWGAIRRYSDTAQRTDDLFFEFARLLRDLQPKTFIAENVSGLVRGKAKGYFKRIFAALKDCGYRVEARLLDAQWLGVPQSRRRLIFIGVRNDLGLAPVFPKPLPYRYSLREVLPWISKVSL